MKIGFDVSDLVTGRADGTTRYTYELAKRLPTLGKAHDWLYFSSGKPQGNFQFSETSFQMVTSPWPKYWTQSRLPFDLLRHRPDVMFMPIQQLPYVRPGGMKTVAVVHDLAFHIYPEQFTYKDWLLQHVFTAYACRQADKIICVSQATADDVGRYYGRTGSVDVVHHGVDHERFRRPTDEEREKSWEELRKWSDDLRKPFVLYVGQIQPRKNLVRLVEAYETLTRELQLVIAGSHGWLNEGIYGRVKESRATDDILMPGRVPEKLLPALYWHAEAFVLPSLYEGFGMPLLEAMACGCPVVTANVSSLPEVVGSAGVLVEPNSVDDIARGIGEARERREELVEAGAKRASEFSWDKTARATLDVVTR